MASNVASSKPKVFFVINSIAEGGAARSILRIAQGLKGSGFQVKIFTIAADDAYHELLRHQELSGKEGGFVKKISALCLSTFRLSKIIRKERPTTVVSFLPRSNILAVMATLLSGKRGSTKLIVSERIAPSSNFKCWNFVQRNAWRCIVRLFYPFADRVLVSSRFSANELKRFFGLRAQAIPNPIEVKKTIHLSRFSPKHPWGRSKIPFFVSIGRLECSQKDQYTLLRAFALIRKRKKSRLIILGDGPDRKDLENYAKQLGIKNDVLFLGFNPNPFPYLARCTAFIHTAVAEGFGNVIIEALALGKPVIATDCPHGPKEILDNGRFGILVPMGDYKSIASAAIKILNSKKYALKLGTEAKKRAKEFDSKWIIPRYVSFLANHID